MVVRESGRRYVACRRGEGNGSGTVRLRLMWTKAAVLPLETRICNVEGVVAAVRALAEDIVAREMRGPVAAFAAIITGGSDDFSGLFGHGALRRRAESNVARRSVFRNPDYFSRTNLWYNTNNNTGVLIVHEANTAP